MTAKAIQQHAGTAHIRPFNPYRDLGDLANLMEVAFADELASTGSRIVRDMRQMALYGPLLPLVGMAVPSFTGFVWVEDGKMVGNVTLTQENDTLGIWAMSNVAVLPEFRGRGIAGQLVDVAIEHVRRSRGTRIVLQVRACNQPALALYQHRGFTRFDTMHELDLTPQSRPVFVGRAATPLRRVRASDGDRLYQLAILSTPREVLHVRPIRAQQFHRGLRWQIQQMLAAAFDGPRQFEVVGEANHEIVAYGSITARLLRGPHEMQLYVSPKHRGLWEMSLAEELLRWTMAMPAFHVRAYVSASHPEAIRALGKLGFETLRVLDQMCLWLT